MVQDSNKLQLVSKVMIMMADSIRKTSIVLSVKQLDKSSISDSEQLILDYEIDSNSSVNSYTFDTLIHDDNEDVQSSNRERIFPFNPSTLSLCLIHWD
jgi:hypothetical protein